MGSKRGDGWVIKVGLLIPIDERVQKRMRGSMCYEGLDDDGSANQGPPLAPRDRISNDYNFT